MRIFIATFGSRGDVEPFLALGLGLKRAGHEVVLCTARRFERWIADHGLDARVVSDDLLDLMDTEDGRTVMDPAGRPLAAMRAGLRMNKAAGPINESMMRDYWAAAQDLSPDIILFHPKVLAAPHIAEKLGAKPILAMLQPMLVPTGAFPAAGVPALPLGGWFNRLTYKAVAAGYGAYAKAIDRFRLETLGLAKAPKAMWAMRDAAGRAIPVLHGFSRHVVSRPDDWPEHAYVNGYWMLPDAPDWTPPPDLAEFLEAGPAPVFFGFGSIAGRDPRGLAQTIVAALGKTGRRGVLATGWGGLQPDAIPGSVFVLKGAPYSWLFPRVAAVVHHGGAGTTAAGLAAGRPTLVCPFFGDQGFWGAQVRALGAGPKPIAQKALTRQRLASAIRRMTSDGGAMQSAAGRIGEALRREDGVSETVALIERLAE